MFRPKAAEEAGICSRVAFEPGYPPRVASSLPQVPFTMLSHTDTDVDRVATDKYTRQKWLGKTEQWNEWKLWASRWTEDGLASRSYR